MIPHVPSLHTLAAVLLGAWAGTATGLVVTAPVQDAGVYWHVSATFGPRLPVPDGKNGTVVEANPINACEALNPDLNPNVAGQIVLAERGSCDFIQKVRNAQQAGAIAVVVYNDEGEHLFKMYSSDDNTEDVQIPSVFVTTGTGRALPGASVVINATGEYDFGDDDFMHPYFFMAIILLGLSVTLACTLTATLVGYVVVSFKTRRQRSECKRAVDALKTRTYRNTHEVSDGGDETCIICLEDYCEGDCLKELPCGHFYHKQCIDPWLMQKSSLCPLCKQNIVEGAEDLHATPRPGEGGGGGGGPADDERPRDSEEAVRGQGPAVAVVAPARGMPGAGGAEPVAAPAAAEPGRLEQPLLDGVDSGGGAGMMVGMEPRPPSPAMGGGGVAQVAGHAGYQVSSMRGRQPAADDEPTTDECGALLLSSSPGLQGGLQSTNTR
jgi:hypothetical protein